MNQTKQVAIGLGSNIGDRLAYLKSACERIAEDVLSNPRCSRIYESPAWGGVATSPFLNCVVVGDSDWKPPALMNYLKSLESELGRIPGPRYGDREIDLDLLLFGNEVWSDAAANVPHPRLAERSFVILPLAELLPNWFHPQTKLTVEQMKTKVASSDCRPVFSALI